LLDPGAGGGGVSQPRAIVRHAGKRRNVDWHVSFRHRVCKCTDAGGILPRMAVLTRGEVLRRIVERTDLDEFAERVLDSFWDRPEFQQLHPPREEVLEWVRWNLALVIRWLIHGIGPGEVELQRFRKQARMRAEEGIAADIVPANFRLGARFAWGAMLDAATEEERPALLESADLLFDYVDRVSRIFSDVYEAAARLAPIAVQESAARALLGRIARDEPELAEDHQLADRIGFQLGHSSRPFVVAAPGHPAQHHADLAARLRQRGALAASEGRRVVGLSNHGLPWRALALDAKAAWIEGPPLIGAERGRALDELRTVIEVAGLRGRAGEVRLGDYLPELLLRRSPRIAGQLAARMYRPLSPELTHTLDLLVEHSFERGATAAALPVHRNTLRDRINRISELTGVDLDSVEGRGLAWLAWLQRRDSTSRSATLEGERPRVAG
jgi:PucR C-terminal helix-turn-helix domain